MIENANSIEQHVIQIRNGIIKYVNVNVKIILTIMLNYLALLLRSTISDKILWEI